MKFSTRATYGLRLCFLIACSADTVSLTTLSERTDISKKYSEQILGMLRRGGIIVAERGQAGGYKLSRQADQITLKQILEALDDAVEIADCAQGKCNDAYCPNKNVFKSIYEAVDKLTQEMTLQSMINQYKCM